MVFGFGEAGDQAWAIAARGTLVALIAGLTAAIFERPRRFAVVALALSLLFPLVAWWWVSSLEPGWNN
jgi:hypothetical protein